MTIIQPNKESGKINLATYLLITISVISAGWGVFVYNKLVNLRHEIEDQNISLRNSEVLNAELKNNIYNIVDANSLETFAQERALVLDNNPTYIRLNQNKQLTRSN